MSTSEQPDQPAKYLVTRFASSFLTVQAASACTRPMQQRDARSAAGVVAIRQDHR